MNVDKGIARPRMAGVKYTCIIFIFFFLWYVSWFNGYLDFVLDPLVTVLVGKDSVDGSKVSASFANLIGVLLFIVALFILHRPGEILESMGLKGGFRRGLFYSFMATLPMFIGNFITSGSFNYELRPVQAIVVIFVAGFFEEVIFRGFLFGQLFRYAGWGFLPSSLLVACCFGCLHLYQGDNFVTALSAFAVTAVGSIFFSWVYTEANYKLWYNIGLHTFMNMAWMIFPTDGVGAIGNTFSNIFRVATILLAIVWIVVYKRRHRLPFIINKHTLLLHR